MHGPILLWFRRDLRLRDHPALSWALEQKRPFIGVFIWAPEEETPWAPGAASRWWLHGSLESLDASLKPFKTRLILRRGKSLDQLLSLVKQTGATSVIWSRLYEPTIVARDKAIEAALSERGIETLSFNSQLLVEPWELQTQKGGPFKVFAPFYKTAHSRLTFLMSQNKPAPLDADHRWQPAPRASAKSLIEPESLPLDDLKLRPAHSWAQKFQPHWTPGEVGAQTTLSHFLNKGLKDYASLRDFPSAQGTSQVSPHLHFGEISPQQILRALKKKNPHFYRSHSGETFYRELLWREFAHHILFHFPQTSDEPLNPRFLNFPWIQSPSHLRLWARGQTGFPLVDAGMRQLWATGWMHNRVRMVVASFLTKDLRLSWKEGATWFWDTLVDANLANNSLGWQWAAGCGADAAPYFRIFNPATQAKRFDPQGHYIKHWIPELASCDSSFIHEPSTSASCPRAYPSPMVDHKVARLAALDSYR